MVRQGAVLRRTFWIRGSGLVLQLVVGFLVVVELAVSGRTLLSLSVLKGQQLWDNFVIVVRSDFEIALDQVETVVGVLAQFFVRPRRTKSELGTVSQSLVCLENARNRDISSWSSPGSAFSLVLHVVARMLCP